MNRNEAVNVDMRHRRECLNRSYSSLFTGRSSAALSSKKEYIPELFYNNNKYDYWLCVWRRRFWKKWEFGRLANNGGTAPKIFQLPRITTTPDDALVAVASTSRISRPAAALQPWTCRPEGRGRSVAGRNRLLRSAGPVGAVRRIR